MRKNIQKHLSDTAVQKNEMLSHLEKMQSLELFLKEEKNCFALERGELVLFC